MVNRRLDRAPKRGTSRHKQGSIGCSPNFCGGAQSLTAIRSTYGPWTDGLLTGNFLALRSAAVFRFGT